MCVKLEQILTSQPASQSVSQSVGPNLEENANANNWKRVSPYVQKAVRHLLVYPNCVKATRAAPGPGFKRLMNALRAASNRSRLTSPVHATAVALIPRCFKTHHYVANEFLKKTHFVGRRRAYCGRRKKKKKFRPHLLQHWTIWREPLNVDVQMSMNRPLYCTKRRVWENHNRLTMRLLVLWKSIHHKIPGDAVQ